MNIRAWAGEATLPSGWPAEESTSLADHETIVHLRRICFGRNPRKTLLRVLVWATVTILSFQYLLVPIKVSGASMAPTYRDGSVNFINRLSYTSHGPIRGDVVVIQDEDHDLILKRVVGVPGEVVTLYMGTLHVNGKPLNDQFSKHPINWEIEPCRLGPNEYFVIGDNRTASIFGKYRKDQILGKIVF